MVSIHPSTYLTYMWRETYPPSGGHFVGHPSFTCVETGERLNPADDPVVFVAYDLFCTLLTREHTVPNHDNRSLVVTPEDR
jgi:hypothetical protein